MLEDSGRRIQVGWPLAPWPWIGGYLVWGERDGWSRGRALVACSVSCAALMSSMLRSYHDPPSLLGLGNPPPISMALAPGDGAVKTATKGRKRSMGRMETTLSATLQSGRDRDNVFMCQTLEAYETDQLAQDIASLLRDGMLHRAMLKACAQPLPANLGMRFLRSAFGLRASLRAT